MHDVHAMKEEIDTAKTSFASNNNHGSQQKQQHRYIYVYSSQVNIDCGNVFHDTNMKK